MSDPRARVATEKAPEPALRDDARYLLDLAPGAIAAFGLRPLRAGRDGEPAAALLRLRAGGDGREEEFAGGPDGRIDAPAIGRFIGSAEAFCAAWYDQSDHGNHAESVAAGPGFAVSAGGGAVVRFAAPAQLRSPATLQDLSAFSLFAVFHSASVAGAASVARWQQEGDFVVFPYHTGSVLIGRHAAFHDALPLGIDTRDFAVYGVVWQQGAADGFATYRNGALVARRAARDLPIAVREEPLFIGSYGGRSEYFQGDLVELVVWPRALSQSEIRAVADNMRKGAVREGGAASDQSGNAAPPVAVGGDLAGLAAAGGDLAARIDRIAALDEAGLAQLGMDRLTAEILGIIGDPDFAAWPLAQQSPMIERISAIYTGHWHASGRLLIAALERLFHRALDGAGAALDTLCLFYDLLYFLYWSTASDNEAMRGMAERVMHPFAVALRTGAIDGLPEITPRPLGSGKLRVGYLAFFPQWTAGPAAQVVLGALLRHFPQAYRPVLYDWSGQDPAWVKAFAASGVEIRRFTPKAIGRRIAAAAEAIARDEIDVLITDTNSALPTVLFEGRAAPVQIYYQIGLPYWPIANIDAVFRTECYDARRDGFDPAVCFDLGLGHWRHPEYSPAVADTRIAAERARFPAARHLIGTYGRLAKLTPDFLEILETLLERHPQLVIVLGGNGDGGLVRDFIAARGLAGRLVLVDQWVDAHLWGHLLEVFLDTFPSEAGLAGREIMAKGKPIVALRSHYVERDRVPMLIADDPGGYADLVSRLLDDPDFYDAACAATRAFVAAQPGEAEYAAAIHQALNKILQAAREELSMLSRDATLSGRIERLRALSNDDVARLGMEHVVAEIREILDAPAFLAWPLAMQLPMLRRVYEIYGGHWHASGHALIPTIEAFFRRALASPGVALETLCLFYDLLYHLYFFVTSDYALMRPVAERVMQPFTAAIRDGLPRGLPAVTQRQLGVAPLRLGYLSYFPDWPMGATAEGVLVNFSRYFPGKYRLVLYAWAGHDDEALAAFADTDILVHRFARGSTAERIAALAAAIAADEIDILISDMNMALPTVLFELRAAPVQIFLQVGLPFWPLANLDGVFLQDELDPAWQAFPPEKCFRMDLGAWYPRVYAPPVDPELVAEERGRFPRDAKLVGTYVRFAKITPAYLEVVGELLARHRQLVVAIGGTGDATMIRDFIAARGDDGRLVLINEWVDGHVWGHMFDVFLDTFPIPGGVAGREVMAKGYPVVAMRVPWLEGDRVPMLIADDAAAYVALVSRLLEDPSFHEAACAATRAFVAERPGEAEHTATIETAVTAVVDRVRRAASPC